MSKITDNDDELGILSGLEVPRKKRSREHYYPKSLVPPHIGQDPNNIFMEHKILNSIKSNLPPCIWEEEKWERCWYALVRYTITSKDKEFVQRALTNWLDFKINPCQNCICNTKYTEYCIKNIRQLQR